MANQPRYCWADLTMSQVGSGTHTVGMPGDGACHGRPCDSRLGQQLSDKGEAHLRLRTRERGAVGVKGCPPHHAGAPYAGVNLTTGFNAGRECSGPYRRCEKPRPGPDPTPD